MKKTQDQRFLEYAGIITSGKLQERRKYETYEQKHCLHAICANVKTTEQSYMHCWAYFAVVSSTNRLTRLFSRVLKYCGETEAYDQENVTTTDIKLTPREKPPQSPEVKVQHTGSEEFGEKRQKPGRAQKILLPPNLPFDRTVLLFSVREERAFNSI